MIETFFVWLLGPNLAGIAGCILVFLFLLAVIFGPILAHHFYDVHERWPWEKNK